MTATGARSPVEASSPPDLVARFRTALDRLWPDAGRFGLAVSGGSDSLALLLLAQASIPGRFEVGTVDHGLRQESAAEAAMVAEICAAVSVPCEVLRATVEAGNVQSMARRARYGELAGWAERRGLSAVATAHHADDQAETLLMRLNRGSGVGGLAGVRETGSIPGSAVPLIRPLLGFRRSELEAILTASGLEAVQDPSNRDDRFDRVRIRMAMAESGWLDPMALATAAANLADAEEALQWAADQAWTERVEVTADDLRSPPGPPHEISMRIVKRAIAGFGNMPRGTDLARLLERLERGEGGTLGSALVTVEDDEWVFRREPPRRKA